MYQHVGQEPAGRGFGVCGSYTWTICIVLIVHRKCSTFPFLPSGMNRYIPLIPFIVWTRAGAREFKSLPRVLTMPSRPRVCEWTFIFFFLSFSFLPSSAGLELLRLPCIMRYIGRYRIMWYALFFVLFQVLIFEGQLWLLFTGLFCMVWGKWWACACWCLLLISSLLNLAEMSHPLFHFWPLHLPIVDFMKGRWKLCDLSSFWVENWITIQILWTTPIISGLSNPCIHAEPSTRVF